MDINVISKYFLHEETDPGAAGAAVDFVGFLSALRPRATSLGGLLAIAGEGRCDDSGKSVIAVDDVIMIQCDPKMGFTMFFMVF